MKKDKDVTRCNFLKVSEPSNPSDEIAQHDSKKKSLSDEFFFFSIESSESDRVFNYLRDSNSIFRTAGINSEIFSGGTVVHLANAGSFGTKFVLLD